MAQWVFSFLISTTLSRSRLACYKGTENEQRLQWLVVLCARLGCIFSLNFLLDYCCPHLLRLRTVIEYHNDASAAPAAEIEL